MTIAKIYVSDNVATVCKCKPVTSGTIGASVEFEFDESWDDMSKTYVWCGSGKCIVDTTASGIIPAEVMTDPHTRLKVGVYGTKDNVATPTTWADLCVIVPGAEPDGDPACSPSLPVWKQLENKIDSMVYVVNFNVDTTGETLTATTEQNFAEVYRRVIDPRTTVRGLVVVANNTMFYDCVSYGPNSIEFIYSKADPAGNNPKIVMWENGNIEVNGLVITLD